MVSSCDGYISNQGSTPPWRYGFKPMKTVRPDEFASPYYEDSIISIASRSDNQTR
ncbi:hypothetical protein YC2023_065954 [Brassica napus]